MMRRIEQLESELGRAKSENAAKEQVVSNLMKARQDQDARLGEQAKQIASLLEERKSKEDRKADELEGLLNAAKKEVDYLQKQYQ